jgi:hypothetical protein
MRIALIDPFLGGHHQTYLQLYTYTLLGLGYEVTLFCADPHEIFYYIQQKNELYIKNLKCYEFNSFLFKKSPIKKLNVTYNACRLWRITASIIKNACVKNKEVFDLVFFLWADSYLAPLILPFIIDMVFPYPWAGLYFGPLHLRVDSNSSPIRRFLLNTDIALISKYCKAVAILDEGVISKLTHRISKKFCTVFPDITDESPPDSDYEIVKEIKKRSGNKIVVAIIGGLSKTKGVINLLKASEYCPDVFFVFAGNLREEQYSQNELDKLKSLNKFKEKYFCYFERIPDEGKYNALIQSSDVLYAAYLGYPHSSNTLTKAALFKKAVIVNNNHCPAERVKKYKMGVCISENNIMDCVEKINWLSKAGNLKKLQQEARFDQYLKIHNLNMLQCKLKELIQYSMRNNS